MRVVTGILVAAVLGALYVVVPNPLGVRAAAYGGVAICHADGQGRTRLISVDDHAIPAHTRHGDAAPATFYADADGDGFGDPGVTVQACSAPAGFVTNDGDCDDTVAGRLCVQTEFVWEVSTNGGATWFPVTLPDTNFGCSFCTRLYRTFVIGAPTDVTFRFGSDNEAQMLVNGTPAYTDFYVNNADWCTKAACCSQCADTFANATNVVNAQTPTSLSPAALSLFGPGLNEIRWQVNQQTGGSGFHTVMTVTQ